MSPEPLSHTISDYSTAVVAALTLDLSATFTHQSRNLVTGAGIEPAACGLKAPASLCLGSSGRCTTSMKMHHQLRRGSNVRHHLGTISPAVLCKTARVADIIQVRRTR